jgi:hypothetical protein
LRTILEKRYKKIGEENACISPTDDEQKVLSLMLTENMINLTHGHDKERIL